MIPRERYAIPSPTGLPDAPLVALRLPTMSRTALRPAPEPRGARPPRAPRAFCRPPHRERGVHRGLRRRKLSVLPQGLPGAHAPCRSWRRARPTPPRVLRCPAPGGRRQGRSSTEHEDEPPEPGEQGKTRDQAHGDRAQQRGEAVTWALGLMLSTSSPKNSSGAVRGPWGCGQVSSPRRYLALNISARGRTDHARSVARDTEDATLSGDREERMRSGLSERRVDGLRDDLLGELEEFLRMPSISAQKGKPPSFRGCAQWVASKLEEAGAQARIHGDRGPPGRLRRGRRRGEDPPLLRPL